MSTCKTFMKTSFICGFSPEMRFTGLQANGALTLKAALIGEVLHVAVPLASLLEALEKAAILPADKTFHNPEAFCDIIENLDLAALKKLSAHGCELYYHKQVPGELLAIPMGWFTMELSMKGSVVVCARKGYFLKESSDEMVKQYDSVRTLFHRCGRNVERYDQLLELLKPKAAALAAPATNK